MKTTVLLACALLLSALAIISRLVFYTKTHSVNSAQTRDILFISEMKKQTISTTLRKQQQQQNKQQQQQNQQHQQQQNQQQQQQEVQQYTFHPECGCQRPGPRLSSLWTTYDPSPVEAAARYTLFK
jgi:Ulp1 family protease